MQNFISVPFFFYNIEFIKIFRRYKYIGYLSKVNHLEYLLKYALYEKIDYKSFMVWRGILCGACIFLKVKAFQRFQNQLHYFKWNAIFLTSKYWRVLNSE